MSSFSKAKRPQQKQKPPPFFNRSLLLKHCTFTTLYNLQSLFMTIISFDRHTNPVEQVFINTGIWQRKKFRHTEVKRLTQLRLHCELVCIRISCLLCQVGEEWRYVENSQFYPLWALIAKKISPQCVACSSLFQLGFSVC